MHVFGKFSCSRSATVFSAIAFVLTPAQVSLPVHDVKGSI